VQRKGKKITPLDIVVTVFLLSALAYVTYRIKIGLNYHWNWGAIPQYLWRHDEETGRWVVNILMEGLFTTIRLSVWGTLLATVLGVTAGLCRVSHSLFNRLIGRLYVEFTRNMPPLVFILIFYYFVSDQIIPLLGLDDFVLCRPKSTRWLCSLFFSPPALFSAFVSAVVSLALFEGAYIAEIVRAGIQSIDRGQWEAAYALGLSRWQQMRHVILPQALRRILPPLAGQFISLVKDSSIVSVISVQELTFQASQLMAATYFTFEIWITVTALYLAVTLTCSLLVARLEARLAEGRF
jgi:polar amino acid transport system permease protein